MVLFVCLLNETVVSLFGRSPRVKSKKVAIFKGKTAPNWYQRLKSRGFLQFKNETTTNLILQPLIPTLLITLFFFIFIALWDDLRFNSFLFKKVHHHVGCTVCTTTDIAFTTQFYFIQVYLNNNCNIWFMHSPSIT